MTVTALQHTRTGLTARVRGTLDRLTAEMAAHGLPGVEDVLDLPVRLHRTSSWSVSVADPMVSPALHISARVASLPDEQLAGILAHEVGHVCDPSQRRLGHVDVAARLALLVSPALPAAFGVGPGAAVAIAALQLTRHRREYSADAFAHRIGHGPGLQAFLAAFAAATGESLARTSSRRDTHPSAGDRIRRLAALDARRAAG